MRTVNRLTTAYAAVQATFWMSFCIAVGFATVYLQELGYTNTALGAIMAVGNLLGALLGPLLSTLIDRHERITAAKMTPPLLAAQAIVLILLMLHPAAGVTSSVCFALYIAFALSVNSLNLKLYADVSYNGFAVNYGFARGMGSLAYVIVSVLVGIWVERASVRVLPLTALGLCLLQLAAFFLFTGCIPKRGALRKGEEEGGASMLEFVRNNRRFCVLLFSTVLLFFAHSTVGNFLINVTRNVGGDTGTMGLLNGFMAAVEIPVMLLYSRFFGKRSSKSVLRVAFVFFLLKIAAIAAASSIPTLTAAMVLQAPSFALYAAAIVPYVELAVRHEDSAKAQSLAFTMTTIGSLLASVISGRLFDRVSVTATLYIACAVCAIGVILAWFGTAEAG